MIIRFPTALYLPGLPTKASDGGNVTYTISTTDPPRRSRSTTLLPPAIEFKKLEELTITDEQRRNALGQQIYTITESKASGTGSAKKQFEIGQVLEFVIDDSATVVPMLISEKTEIRHDTNLLDLLSLGLSEDDIDSIGKQAAIQLDVLKSSLNIHRQNRRDAEVSLNENKKSQNETKKALEAIRQLNVSTGSFTDAIEKLEQNQSELEAAEVELIETANSAAALAASTLDDIRELAQVVR